MRCVYEHRGFHYLSSIIMVLCVLYSALWLTASLARTFEPYYESPHAAQSTSLPHLAAPILDNSPLESSQTYSSDYYEEAFCHYLIRGDYEKAYQQLLQALRGAGTSSAAVVYAYLYSLIEPYAGHAEEFCAELKTLAKRAVETEEVFSRLQWYYGIRELQYGDSNEARRILSGLGFLTDCYILGPFDNEGGLNFDRALAPEQEDFSPSASYQGLCEDTQWRSSPVEPINGYVDLWSLCYASKPALAYAYLNFESVEQTDVVLKIGSPGPVKIWVNEALVHVGTTNRGVFFSQDVSQVLRLRKGANRLLLKVAQNPNTNAWGFWLRIRSAAQGAHSQAPLLDAFSSQPDKPLSMIQALEADCAASPSLRACLHLGVLYAVEQPTDPREQKAALWFQRAQDLASSSSIPSLLEGIYQNDRNKQRQAYERAIAIEPDNIEARFRLAEFYLGSAMNQKASALTQEILSLAPNSPRARYLLARYCISKNYLYEALDVLKRLMADQPHLHAVSTIQNAEIKWLYVSKLKAILPPLERLQLLHDLLQTRTVRKVSVLSALTALYLAEAKWDKAEEALKQQIARQPFGYALWLQLAQQRIGRQEYATALEAVEKGLAIRPFDPELLKVKGQILHFLGRDQEALVEWDRSLTAKENQPKLKEYLAYLRLEGESYAERYAISFADIKEAALREEPTLAGQANIHYLLRQTIVQVNKDGSRRETRRLIVKILTEKGSRDFRSFSLGYVPEREIVTIKKAQVMQPDGSLLHSDRIDDSSFAKLMGVSMKLYGDYIHKIIYFPGVRVNSIVELEYEIADKMPNLYTDYFGDIHFFSRYEPTFLSQYVLITPAERTFLYQTVGTTLEPTIELSSNNSLRIYIWTARNLPDIEREPYMPPDSEVLPYLIVTTFKNWDEVATWYWGLVREQLLLPQMLKDKAADLMRDAPTHIDMVGALYKFVVTEIRYLGLELGVYGYKPHEAAEVFKAQYGDCKDKATLLMAMLREAGIPSDIVLVRTRHRGKMDHSLASLGLFNHAILHIANLDGKEWWLDGTAQYHSFQELPFADQDTVAFVINSSGGTFKQIPLSTHMQNQMIFNMEIRISPDGTAYGKRTVRYHGLSAPPLRRYYQNAEKAKPLVEQALNSKYPGSRIEEIELSDVTDLDESPRLSYTFSIPNFLQMTNGHGRFKPFLLPSNLSETYALLSSRRYDLLISYPETLRRHYTFKLDDGLTIHSVPEPVELKAPFGSFSVRFEIGENTIELYEELKTTKHRISAQEYETFRRFCNQVDRTEESEVIIRAAAR